MIFDTDGQCFIATKKADWEGWTILIVQPFKPGVDVVYCKRPARYHYGVEFRTVYCNHEVTPDVI